jgi:hypothetical protein
MTFLGLNGRVRPMASVACPAPAGGGSANFFLAFRWFVERFIEQKNVTNPKRPNEQRKHRSKDCCCFQLKCSPSIREI